jgi:predicted TIM-barrel enzyme
MALTRKQCLSKLRETVRSGSPLLGVGAGTGISAKFAEAGGADLIIIYNSGRYRMAGRGSLAGLMLATRADRCGYGWRVLPVVKQVPVLAGSAGPTRSQHGCVLPRQTTRLRGSQNFPTVGLSTGFPRIWKRPAWDMGSKSR